MAFKTIWDFVKFFPGAEGESRTPTPLRVLDPEPSASTNSTTSARRRFIVEAAKIGKSFCSSGAKRQQTPLASVLQSILHYRNAKTPPEDAVNSPAENLQSMLCIQPIRPPSTIVSIENDAIQALAASGSDTPSPELATFLQHVEEHGHRVASSGESVSEPEAANA